ncbi:MAG: Bug family tripartite tricarboxylate transporter substrate binding protein [Burkholderiales bacterium]
MKLPIRFAIANQGVATFSALIGISCLAAITSSQVAAQTYPSKPIRIVVPFAPGGVDITARLLQPKMQEDLGQALIIENRPGAGGVTGSVAVSKSPADGYTLLMTASGTLISTPLLSAKPAFDPINDFSPITVVFQAVSTLVVNASLPVNSVKELIDHARRNPSKVGFASPGIGTNQHMDGEVFKATAGLDIFHVPYKGFGPSIQDLVAGHIQLGFVTYANIRAHLSAGKVKIIAVGDAKRYPPLAAVPTIAETLPSYQRVPGWSGALLGPPGLSKAISTRLYSAALKAINTPEVRSKLDEGGSLVMGITPEEFTALLKSDLERVGKIVKSLGIKVDEP